MQQEKIKKVFLWILTATLFGAHLFFRGQVQADEFGWNEFQSQSGDYRISFPVSPQMIHQNLKIGPEQANLQYKVYLAPYQESAICLLLVAEYPGDLQPGQEQVGLDGLLKGILNQNAENQLVFSEAMQNQGFPGISFLIDSGRNYFRAQAIMVHNKLYLIAMEGVKEKYKEPLFQRFLKTFALSIPKAN